MKKDMRCPHCGKRIGVFISSDEDSTAKVIKSNPNKEIGLKEKYVESKCPRCKEMIYIYMGFED